ncbi:ornithine cyclodeaminase family protein [Prolixibacteraceae bacterium JC049]|nr:ornithine cyclodeaminase family protein [Prolixibacteraceae bacterium JC049]
MRILNHKHIDELVDWEALILTIEKAYQTQLSGCFNMPQRMHIHQNDNTLLLMPCFTENRFATKLVSVFPNNVKNNQPAIYGQVILNDGETGEAKALLNGGKLTAIRTGAVGACAMQKLDPNATTLGVVGAGAQGQYQAIAAAHILPLKTVFIFDLNPESVKQFKETVSEKAPQLEIVAVQSTTELVKQSEIVVTATTSPTPVLPDNQQLLKGKTFIGIGSFKPNMQEFPEALFHLIDECYIDTIHAQHETGDIIQPLVNRWIDQSQLVPFAQLLQKERAPQKTQLFKSVGMALFDIYVANWLYDQALKIDIGTEIEL